MQRICDPLTVGDVEPYPYFVFEREILNTTTKVVSKVAVDIGTVYTNIKFCARHERNVQDFSDHANDDIYANLTYDDAGVNGVAHFVWGDTSGYKPGRYFVKLEYERATDGNKYHGSFLGYFDVVDKMEGTFGIT